MSDKLQLEDSVMTIGDVSITNNHVPTAMHTTIVVKRQRPWITIFINILMVLWPVIAISFQVTLGVCLLTWVIIIGFRALLALFEG
jgi:nitrate reductase NapE component